MALPAIPVIGKAIASTGLFAGVSRAGSRVIPRARGAFNSLSQNARAALGFGGGAAAGAGGNEILTRLGIEDSRLQTMSIIGAALVAVFAVGQLFDVGIEL